MSKKNKKWDEPTPESIISNFQALDDICSGKLDISNLGVINYSKGSLVMDNGLSPEVSDMIYKRSTSNTQTPQVKPVAVHPVEDVTEVEEEDILSEDDFLATLVSGNNNENYEVPELDENEINALVNEVADVDDEDDDVTREIYMRMMYFTVLEKLNRLVIDDGLAPTSFSFDYALDKDLNNHQVNGVYDASDVVDKYALLLNYIVSLKHPAAIYTLEEFEYNENLMTNPNAANNTYNYKVFKFFNLNDKYILCYYIDPDTYNEFTEICSKNYPVPNDILQVLVSMAYACGRIDNAFFAEDDEYVTKLYSDSELNFKDEFAEIFWNHPDTCNEVNEDNDDESLDIIENIMDVEEIQTNARQLISMLVGEPYFDEDEDDNDFDDEDEDDNDFDDEDEDDDTDEVEESSTESDDVADTEEVSDDLLGDDMESVDVEPSEEKESLIIDVHRKTDKN